MLGFFLFYEFTLSLLSLEISLLLLVTYQYISVLKLTLSSVMVRNVYTTENIDFQSLTLTFKLPVLLVKGGNTHLYK